MANIFFLNINILFQMFESSYMKLSKSNNYSRLSSFTHFEVIKYIIFYSVLNLCHVGYIISNVLCNILICEFYIRQCKKLKHYQTYS